MHLNKNGYEVKKAGFTSIATIQGDWKVAGRHSWDNDVREMDWDMNVGTDNMTMIENSIEKINIANSGAGAIEAAACAKEV